MWVELALVIITCLTCCYPSIIIGDTTLIRNKFCLCNRFVIWDFRWRNWLAGCRLIHFLLCYGCTPWSPCIVAIRWYAFMVCVLEHALQRTVIVWLRQVINFRLIPLHFRGSFNLIRWSTRRECWNLIRTWSFTTKFRMVSFLRETIFVLMTASTIPFVAFYWNWKLFYYSFDSSPFILRFLKLHIILNLRLLPTYNFHSQLWSNSNPRITNPWVL